MTTVPKTNHKMLMKTKTRGVCLLQLTPLLYRCPYFPPSLEKPERTPDNYRLLWCMFNHNIVIIMVTSITVCGWHNSHIHHIIFCGLIFTNVILKFVLFDIQMM